MLQKIKDVTVDMFIVKDGRREPNPGHIYNISREIVNGLVLITRKKYRIVLPYNLLEVASVLMIIAVLLYCYLYNSEINLFKTSGDLAYCFAMFLICLMMKSNGVDAESLSLDVDRWWTYAYLEEETTEVKNITEKKLTASSENLLKFMKTMTISYNFLPVLRYLYNGCSDVADMLVIISLPEAPWVYFELLFGWMTVFSSLLLCTWTVNFLVSIIYTEIAQLQLAAIAFVSIERRVAKMMDHDSITLTEYNADIFQLLVHNEIKACAKHYQSIYRQSKQCFQIVSPLINLIYYIGCFDFIAMGVLLAGERENYLMLIQASVMVISALFLQFVFSYLNDSLNEEVIKLKLVVYGSDWRTISHHSQKTVHILQTMLMYCPKITTLLGSEGTLEFFSKVVNAGYFYLTGILAMKQ